MSEEWECSSSKRPPLRIETERTVIRCYNTDDAAMLIATIGQSLDHLRQWMTWADAEPESLEAKTKRLQKNRDNFLADIDYFYGIFNRDESELIGGTGLHTRRGPDALEIGYWVGTDHLKQGFATEASAALTKVAFEVSGVTRVEVRCDPNNIASRRVPMKLGFRHETTLEKDETTGDGEPRDTMVWSLDELSYSDSPSNQAVLKAFDVDGNVIAPMS